MRQPLICTKCKRITFVEYHPDYDGFRDTEWITLPGDSIAIPACPHPELLPADIRAQAAALPDLHAHPALCPDCI